MNAEHLVGTWRLRYGDMLTLSAKPVTVQGVERTPELVSERVRHE
jgi:hypothetical protein